MWIHGRDWKVGVLLGGTAYSIPVRSGYIRKERVSEDFYAFGLADNVDIGYVYRWQLRTYIHTAFFENTELVDWLWGEDGVIEPTDKLLDVMITLPGDNYVYYSYIEGVDLVYKPMASELTLVGVGIKRTQQSWTLQELSGGFRYFHRDVPNKAITIGYPGTNYNSMGWELHLRREWQAPRGLYENPQVAVNTGVSVSGRFQLTPDVDMLAENDAMRVEFWIDSNHKIVLLRAYVMPEYPELKAELDTYSYSFTAYRDYETENKIGFVSLVEVKGEA